ncbi:MAG: MipA/OmpV family protein [Pedobacter sp.]|nr:MipA/OmpV family protein [Pedobacter sp.]
MNALRRKFFALLSASLLASDALAMGPTIDIFPDFIGAGVGVTSDYSGSDETFVGALPAGRYQFENSNRFAEWYGPMGDINLLESEEWQLGPALGLRLGRSNVEDVAVARLPEISATVEAGVMASWTRNYLEGVPWRFRIGVTALTDLGNKYDGLNASLFTTFWMPLSPRLFLGIGGGLSYGSESFNQEYYGITPAGAAASGLSAYTPDAGVRQWYAWPALIYKMSPRWVVATGTFYQRISGDPARSPLVAEVGNANQWTSGFGLGRLW